MNNVLTPDRIIKKTAANHTTPGAAIMSGVTPTSTTANLAKDVPLEPKQDASSAAISSATPGSTTAQLAKDVPIEDPSMPGGFPETPQGEPSQFSVDPLPATAGSGNPVDLAPGEKVPDSKTLTENTTTSLVRDDPSLAKSGGESQTFGVAPLPATAGAGNPIHLKPGEKVPDTSTFTANTVKSTATTDKESYEKGPSLGGPPVLPDVVTPQQEREARGVGIFGLPPISKNMIPESSLPIGSDSTGADPGVTISSAGPHSTTADLAGAVPLEPQGAAAEVPDVVKDSQLDANAPPEASASSEMVKEKSAVEAELKKEVPEEPSTSDNSTSASKAAGLAAGGVVTAGGAVAAATYATKDKASEVTGIGKSEPAPTSSQVAPEVPEAVEESIEKAKWAPEAAANEEAVLEKSAVENELLKTVKTEQSTGEPAPMYKTADAPASNTGPESKAPHTTEPKASIAAEPVDSRDVSPMSKPNAQPQALDATAVPADAPTSSTPSQPTTKPSTESTSSPADSASPTTDKKSKRRSIFKRLQDKFHHHKDEA